MESKWHNNSKKRKKKEKGAPQWGDIEKGVKTSIRYWCVYTWKKVKNARKNSQKRGEGEGKKGEKIKKGLKKRGDNMLVASRLLILVPSNGTYNQMWAKHSNGAQEHRGRLRRRHEGGRYSEDGVDIPRKEQSYAKIILVDISNTYCKKHKCPDPWLTINHLIFFYFLPLNIFNEFLF